MAEENRKSIARELPHNLEAEEALLGALIKDEMVAEEIMGELAESDFYSETHRLIFSGMMDIYLENKPIDLVTLSDVLNSKNILEKVGGIDFLAELSGSLLSTANFKEYFEIVKRDSLKRLLIRSSTNIIENCYQNDGGMDDLTFAEGEIFGLSKEKKRNIPVPIGDKFNEVFEKFNAISRDKNAFKGVPTGLKDLDLMLNGLGKSDLILIAARPSEGKTSLAMNFVENAALFAGSTCLVFSLEMSKAQIAQRMLCSNAEVKNQTAMQGNLTPEEWERLFEARRVLSKANIFIDDTPSLTPQEMLSKCRRIVTKEGKLDLIMIDYLQLMSSGNRKLEGNRQQEISEISRKLKLIAREMECPVLALSQLSRMVENRKPPKPQLSDLRDSGAIEQDADVVMFIYNPEKTVTNADGSPAVTGVGKSGIRELIIAKNRNGQIDDIKVRWDAEFVRFKNADGLNKVKTIESVPENPENLDGVVFVDERLKGEKAELKNFSQDE